MIFNVYDMEFNRLGIIDSHIEYELEMNYHKHSTLFLTVDTSDNSKDLLMQNEKLRIITRATDNSRGYLIEIAEYEDAEELKIMVSAKSLSIMTGWRIVLRQQRYQGTIETVMKDFVYHNAVAPSDPNRIVPDLVLSIDEGIPIMVDESFTDRDLDEALWELAIKYDVSFEVLMNHDAKKYVFSVFQGLDRSAQQELLPKITFAKAFDNVTLQSYIDDKSNYRSTAYVAGEGEGAVRKILQVNGELSGHNRREMFVDARDLQSVYTQNGVEHTTPPAEYDALLVARGNNKLAENQRVRSFSSDIDVNAQFTFGEDYFLGDIVSNRNDELGLITHSRIMVVKELSNQEGTVLQHEFGTSIPMPFEKIIKKGAN